MNEGKRTQEIQNIIASMTLEQRVGQLFVLAFPTKDPSMIFDIIDNYGLGGCYISQDNAKTFVEAKNLCAALQKRALQKHAELPLFLGVDQEGAWGVLIPESVIGPGNLALGISAGTSDTYNMYSIFAQEMTSVGYQTIFGPCADVNTDPQNPIIGTRSFGENPKKVALHVTAAVKALKAGGALSTAKHFPGHGNTHGDTHRDIPRVDTPFDELLKNELLPFQAAIDAGVDMIMTSHILFPHIDEKHPATLSKAILTDLLRKKMKFTGLIITDSMNMGAMRKHYSPQESSIKALLAGANLIMLSEEHYDHSEQYLKRQVACIEGIIQAVKQGVISEKILHDRLFKIIEYKLSLQQNNNKVLMSIKEKKQKELQAAQSAIRVLKNENQIYPLKKNQSLAIVNATPQASYYNVVNTRGIGPNQAISAFKTFAQECVLHWNNAKVYSYEEYKKNICDMHDLIIVVTEDYPLPGEDFEKKAQHLRVKEIIKTQKDKLILVGLRSSYELAEYLDVKCYVCSYSSRTCSAKALAWMLTGEGKK